MNSVEAGRVVDHGQILLVERAAGRDGIVEDVVVIVLLEAVEADGGGGGRLVGEHDVVLTACEVVDFLHSVDVGLRGVEASTYGVVIVTRIGAVNVADGDDGE